MTDAFFERSAATTILIGLLGACPEGNTITYETMVKATNRDIPKRDRHLLVSALRTVRRDSRIVFGTTRCVGVQRLRANELVKEGGRRVRIIGRHARTGGVIMDTAEMLRLTPDERLAHASTRGVLASIEDTTRTITPKSRGRANTDPVVRIAS